MVVIVFLLLVHGSSLHIHVVVSFANYYLISCSYLDRHTSLVDWPVVVGLRVQARVGRVNTAFTRATENADVR